MSATSSKSIDPAAVRRARQLLRSNQHALPSMAALYKLLANPVRLKILLCLGEIERLCVGDIAEVVGLSVAATSHQLRLLKERGWLSAEGDGKLVYYSLADVGLRDALAGDLRLLSR
ncbi:MAG: ArsR/SmtB family transcription factor [Gammaproteobacteria bacterium]